MENMNEMPKQGQSDDNIPKVTGIGGVFFFSENVEASKDWYSKNLGMKIDEWGCTFSVRNVDRPEEVNHFQWSLFKSGSTYFEPSKKEFMINYRVQNLEKLRENLMSNGVTILDEIQTFPYGRFLHIIDAEGNKIELWEPVDSLLTKPSEP